MVTLEISVINLVLCKRKNGVSILNMLYNTASLLSLHFRMTSLIFLYEFNYSLTLMLPVIRNY